ncbi:DNA ligase [Vibrio olivae]|uniref:DNA ligase n=1 Tax=Vibrio olivae TaxID=1243002 RepID=A0ABV5HJG7_9VIBR
MILKLSALSVALLLVSIDAHAQNIELNRSPELMQASEFHNELDISAYWLSEKLDGIRVLWDGQQLRTRSGRTLNPPKWFIKSLPHTVVDGELWAGRGQFHLVQQTVLDAKPVDSAWQQIRFMAFDLPELQQPFEQRYKALTQLVSHTSSSFLEAVEQRSISSESQLMAELDSIASQNGEGLMLRRFDRLYQSGRSDTLIKLKKHQDTEAIVVGYKPGQGKYEGMMGSLLVRLPNGIQFYLGSGFSDRLRRQPPQLGQSVTFRYNGYTQNGIPKFARFIRERAE